ncbi:MAG: hypothetical protein A2V62_13405 [Nitrospirae bacterium RBG_19FT_COMBO_58_9]|nr:MAG: hypothetical protein A2V62_13405 [Nitrospirae bacterium RBG_19FT_COMBO_58_9]
MQWWRCGSHDEPDGPETVSGKGEGHDRAATEARTEIQKIGHAFESDVDTAHQWNVLDPTLSVVDQTPSNYMGGDRANDHDKK